MRILEIKENRSLFIDVINSNESRKGKDYLLGCYEYLLRGPLDDEVISEKFYLGLVSAKVKFICHPIDDTENDIVLETEEIDSKKSLEKTKLERLEEIFNETIRSRRELNFAYRNWKLINDPKKVDSSDSSKREQALIRYQEVKRLLN